MVYDIECFCFREVKLGIVALPSWFPANLVKPVNTASQGP